ncbi:carbohydrate ABC transporter permease [Clostridium butyricum]|jgi:raffinose/stachyose/melibiose transport system permease protein|uniref:ABC transporter permease n=1 Tax=Clostridium butyricum TaxID=1492 RepID=A0A512TKN5_CLOBU|nr:sugar ABC transporter permease [Clostridium butyricum]ETI91674.1 MAG: Multiple sugar-binding transport system permease [Clostridium butyricum DORA_1]MDU1004872.1 sugar ABC transporter permease [Clostridium butyricum]MDU1507422.1 sugar ABC transporter permease [Clostridium butyricum]MDU4658814.1 sugar ABC transporter permease [Clostridium butyricum]MDU4800506.1 sugar ABC transporter permease [Clostridium butyricum]
MSKRSKDNRDFWMFVGPCLFALFMVVVIPFFMGIYYTFTNWNGANPAYDFVGFSNYLYIFKDAQFIYSFKITLIYTFASVITINVIGFTLAYIVTRNLKTKNFLRTGFFMPNLIGGLILGFIWQFMFNSVFTGVGQKLGSSILSTSMLQEPSTAVLAMLIVSTWQYAGYIMVIYVSALENVPNDLIEAAHIDGANGIQTFKHITIPMVRQGITICLFLTLANSFKMFDLNFSLSPAKATEMMALNIYKEAFVVNNLGIGQAKAVIFFILVTTISLTQVYFNKKKEVEA